MLGPSFQAFQTSLVILVRKRKGRVQRREVKRSYLESPRGRLWSHKMALVRSIHLILKSHLDSNRSHYKTSSKIRRTISFRTIHRSLYLPFCNIKTWHLIQLIMLDYYDKNTDFSDRTLAIII